MGFFGFYSVLKCFKLLAWPTFALVYPLLPVWPYAKIIAILWLVIPRFDGAGIAYNCFVRPCLSGQLPQVILSFLNKNQEQRDINEDGAEASEELICTKPEVRKPTSSHDDTKTVKILTGIAATADKPTTEPNACVDVEVLTLPAPQVQDVQREWTCAMCQVTTTSEATLNSHLQGRRHKIKCEELKARKQTTMRGATIGGTNRMWYCTICQIKTQSEASWNSHVQGKKHKSKCKELREIVKAAKKNNFSSTATKSGQANQDPNKASSDGGPSYKFSCASTVKNESIRSILGPPPNLSSDTNLKKTLSDGGLNTRFACGVCQMTLQSKATLISHLQGKKHKSNYEQFKAREMREEYALPAA